MCAHTQTQCIVRHALLVYIPSASCFRSQFDIFVSVHSRTSHKILQIFAVNSLLLLLLFLLLLLSFLCRCSAIHFINCKISSQLQMCVGVCLCCCSILLLQLLHTNIVILREDLGWSIGRENGILGEIAIRCYLCCLRRHRCCSKVKNETSRVKHAKSLNVNGKECSATTKTKMRDESTLKSFLQKKTF